MSQKSSLPQAASFVSQVLKRDTERTSFEDVRSVSFDKRPSLQMRAICEAGNKGERNRLFMARRECQLSRRKSETGAGS